MIPTSWNMKPTPTNDHPAVFKRPGPRQVETIAGLDDGDVAHVRRWTLPIEPVTQDSEQTVLGHGDEDDTGDIGNEA